MIKPTRTFTIVDLTLRAAAMCHFCRQGNRPIDESDQEHGDKFVHSIKSSQGPKFGKCDADQLWVLIRKLESDE